MFHFLPGILCRQLHNNAQRKVHQHGRWNAGSLLLHKDSVADAANLLLVVDAIRYGTMEIAGCALCLWAIPYVPHENTEDPFAPFYVPTGDLVFPHEKGLVIRCMDRFDRSDGASVILPIGAAGYTATAEPGIALERSNPSGRECTPTAEATRCTVVVRTGCAFPGPDESNDL